MAVNNMQITDIYQLLNSIHTQATGRSAIAPTNTSEFVSMATTTLAAGTDPVYNALMDTIGRTIFSVRPYDRRFDITRSTEEFGAIRRKISYADKPLQGASDTFAPVDGTAVDPWTINKPDVLEMRYYGSAIYRDSVTIFEDQIKTAFESPAQLGEFVSGLMTHMSNKWEQWQEEQNRATVANFIGAKNAANNGVIHLLTEYKALTGLSDLTAQDIYKPDNLADFFRWVRARINTLSREMSERSGLYQVQVAGKNINRHTPAADQRIYLRADALDIIDAMVNTVTYHDEPLAYADVRGVTYWQAINDPDQINVTPSVINASGVVSTGAAQSISNIFGVMFDKDAVASNVYLYRIANTPLNPKGLYYNTWLNARFQYMNDLTEKGIILLLD